MADFPFAAERRFRHAPPDLRARIVEAVDPEEKVPRAVAAVTRPAGRDVLVLDSRAGSLRTAQLAALGAVVRHGDSTAEVAAASVDVALRFWSTPAGGPDAWQRELDAVERAARPGARFVLVEDYARDDATTLYGDDARAAARIAMSERDGWFLQHGFRIRVLHCWWSFASLEEAREVLGGVFGAPGVALGERLRRPRVSHKVAIYHRSVGGAADGPTSQ